MEDRRENDPAAMIYGHPKPPHFSRRIVHKV